MALLIIRRGSTRKGSQEVAGKPHLCDARHKVRRPPSKRSNGRFQPLGRPAEITQLSGCVSSWPGLWRQATRRLRMSDRIEKTVEMKAPVSRVWRALTDHKEFGEWFRVKLENPFVPGQVTRGSITHPGYEHIEVRGRGEEPWSPSGISPSPGIPSRSTRTQDYSKETPTLVEFTLEPIAGGTRLRVVEFGLRQDPGASPRRSIPHERRRLGGAGEKHRNLRRPCPVTKRPRARPAPPCSRRSATRRGCRFSQR